MAFSSPTIIDVQATWTGSKRGYTAVLMLEESASTELIGKNPIEPLITTGVPKLYDYFDMGTGIVDDRCYCISKRAWRPDPEAKFKWYVELQYETLSLQQYRRTLHPLDRPAEISDGYNIVSAIKQQDTSGAAILNAAGMPFDPGVEGEDARLVVTVTRNFASRVDSLAYNNRVNSDSFLGASAGTLRVFIEQTEEREEFDPDGDGPGSSFEVEYWRVTGQFEYKPEGWQASTLNAGRYQLVAGALKPITEGLVANAPPVSDPWPLTAAGAAIPVASLPGAANYINSDIFYTANFASIGFF